MSSYEDEYEEDDEEDDENDEEFDAPTAKPGAPLTVAIARRARLQQYCWLLVMAGTILIAGSWADAIRPEIGWVGFAIAAVGMMFSMWLTGSPHPRDEHPAEEWD